MFKDRMGKSLSAGEVVTKGTVRVQSVLEEFSVFFLHIIGNVPSHHIRRFFYRMSGMKIGWGSVIHMGARFYDPSGIKIGNDSIIGENVVLDGRAQIIIGDHVDIATDVMIYNSEHDVHDERFGAINAPVIVGNYVFIGPRAIILPGIKVGEGAVVAAGAVVTKDVAPYAIVGGVPAKVITERRSKNLAYRLGRARLFR